MSWRARRRGRRWLVGADDMRTMPWCGKDTFLRWSSSSACDLMGGIGTSSYPSTPSAPKRPKAKKPSALRGASVAAVTRFSGSRCSGYALVSWTESQKTSVEANCEANFEGVASVLGTKMSIMVLPWSSSRLASGFRYL